jgi:catechol 2,3-dioxygenase-like lactoylglutathione lyase family enzyme
VLRIRRTVADLERASAFYRDALGFHIAGKSRNDGAAWIRVMGAADIHAVSLTMRLGAQEIELVAFDPPGKPYPPSSSSADSWFQHVAIIVSDMDAAYDELCHYSFDPISAGGPQRLPPGSGSVIAYKFRDPDGHPLELIQFPAGSGDVAWQRKGATFLGIDHSAIDVDDLQESIDFYVGVLGFSVTSRSVNAGTAQQRLDCAPGVVVNVVALQPAAAGPLHVELLAYRRPQGRRIPTDARRNDILTDTLVLQIQDLACLTTSFCVGRADFISPGLVTLPDGHRAALIRDPTGHHLLLVSL